MSPPLGQSIPSCLVFQNVGQYGTLALTQIALVSGDLRVDYLEVEIKSIGLNAKVTPRCTMLMYRTQDIKIIQELALFNRAHSRRPRTPRHHKDVRARLLW